MNWEQLQGKWDQMKGKAEEKWGKLTQDDMKVIHGKKEQFLGKLRERYGYTADKANQELSAFMQSCSCGSDPQPKAKH